jgi:hypothetical protein
VTPARGRVGDVVSVTPRGRIVDYEIVLEYRGREVVSPRGAVTPAGQPYRFSYARFFAPVDWTIRFFEYPESVHPVKQPEAFAQVLAGYTGQDRQSRSHRLSLGPRTRRRACSRPLRVRRRGHG